MSFKPIFAILIGGLFLGCVSKEEEMLMSDFDRQKHHFGQIQQTQQVTIVQNDRVSALISALYLHQKSDSSISKKYEKFIIGIYSDDDIVPTAMLNGKDAINITKLESDDSRIDGIPLKNRWSRYYIASFLPDDANKMVLKVSLGHLGQRELIFLKVANLENIQE
ncbi:MAG: hypothetical protein RBR33_02900 [Sulfurovaceae bacterium]|nr:hypothetical protein [Sulfurovaceae bacterium]